MVNTNTVTDELDLEWLALMLEARDLGISKESVREFLIQGKVKENVKNGY